MSAQNVVPTTPEPGISVDKEVGCRRLFCRSLEWEKERGKRIPVERARGLKEQVPGGMLPEEPRIAFHTQKESWRRGVAQRSCVCLACIHKSLGPIPRIAKTNRQGKHLPQAGLDQVQPCSCQLGAQGKLSGKLT